MQYHFYPILLFHAGMFHQKELFSAVLFILLSSPLDLGVYADNVVRDFLLRLKSLRRVRKSEPLPTCTFFTVRLYYLSSHVIKSKQWSATSVLDFTDLTCMYLSDAANIAVKYLNPRNVSCCIVPHTTACTVNALDPSISSCCAHPLYFLVPKLVSQTCGLVLLVLACHSSLLQFHALPLGCLYDQACSAKIPGLSFHWLCRAALISA